MLRIGIDLGGTKTEGIVLDANGAILLRERRPTPTARGYEAILHAIADLVAHLETAAAARCHVGIGTPGALSPTTGYLKNSNTTCLNGKPLAQDLERLLARAVQIENDANCFTLSEAIDGAGHGAAVVFGVILGTGVGGGIVVNGQLLPGRHRLAGEWGHNVLEANGPLCYCGKRGCVETFLSGPGFVRDYTAHGGEIGVDAAGIVARAGAGDTLADAALSRYLDRFGRALSTVVNILDPDAVVLGGGLSHIAALYTHGPVQLARHVFTADGKGPLSDDKTRSDATHTRIVRNRHGDSSGVLGAARLWTDA